MERSLEMSLQKQAENEEVAASVRARMKTHLAETRHHGEAVRGCLESLGADTSAIKTGIAEALEFFKGLGTKFARDERVKDLLAAYASEHFEIACYRALRTAAEIAGEEQIVSVCDRILPEEEQMADWLDAQLPSVVREYLAEVETVASR